MRCLDRRGRKLQVSLGRSEFLGKKVFIAGGGRGIGRAVAISLAEAGADVAVSYLRNDRTARLVARQVEGCGHRAILVKGNLRDVAVIDEAKEILSRSFKTVDIFVYCIAMGICRPIRDLSSLQLDRTFEINARTFIVCVNKLRSIMPRGAVIVALSSLGAQRYIKDYASIGMAKAYLEAAIRYLGAELAPGIRVNGVSSGPVLTEGLRVYPGFQEGLKLTKELTPARRLGTPEDVAEIVRFLCSDASQWIYGQTIIADGGLSLRVVPL